MKYFQRIVRAITLLTTASLASCAARVAPVPPNAPPSPPITLTAATLSSSAGSMKFTFEVADSTAVDVKTVELAMLHALVQDEQTGRSIRVFEVVRPMPSFDVDPALRYSDGFPAGQLTVSFPGQSTKDIRMTDESQEYFASKIGTRVALVCDEPVYTKSRSESWKGRRTRLESIQCVVVD